MKAIILCAGLGSRLKERTGSIPKPMIHYKGTPILEKNIELCRQANITDIVINLHHCPEIILEYFGNGEKFGVQLTYSYEDVLLGTAGAVKNNEIFFSGGDFLVIYGDNYSDYDLSDLTARHEEKNADATIAVFPLKNPHQSGIVSVDDDSMVTGFIEKPKNLADGYYLVNMGVYVISGAMINFIPLGFSDFGRDIFPNWCGDNKKIYAAQMTSKVIAIDTPELFDENIKNFHKL